MKSKEYLATLMADNPGIRANAMLVALGKWHREQITLLLAENPGMRTVDIAQQVGCSTTTAYAHRLRIQPEHYKQKPDS